MKRVSTLLVGFLDYHNSETVKDKVESNESRVLTSELPRERKELNYLVKEKSY